jgi:hypothetical protein
MVEESITPLQGSITNLRRLRENLNQIILGMEADEKVEKLTTLLKGDVINLTVPCVVELHNGEAIVVVPFLRQGTEPFGHWQDWEGSYGEFNRDGSHKDSAGIRQTQNIVSIVRELEEYELISIMVGKYTFDCTIEPE